MPRFALCSLLVLAFAGPALAAPERFMVDPVHSTSVFRIKHADIAYFWGKFDEPTGGFTLDDSDLTKSDFTIELNVEKVNTANDKRNDHLKSPDFFNAKQHPKITFKSTSVKRGEGDKMLSVTGDLSMHGITKQITIPVELTGKGQFMGQPRAGVEATMKVKLSDFQIKGPPQGGLADEVKVIVSLEGMKTSK